MTDEGYSWVPRVVRGEGVPPLRREAILASLCRAATRFVSEEQGQDALAAVGCPAVGMAPGAGGIKRWGRLGRIEQ